MRVLIGRKHSIIILIGAALIAVLSLLLAYCGEGAGDGGDVYKDDGGGGVYSSGEGDTATTFSISGMVTSGGDPLQGVTMKLSSAGSGTGTETTNSSGTYIFTGLGRGSYKVTPSKATYGLWSPPNRWEPVSSMYIVGADFAATQVVQIVTCATATVDKDVSMSVNASSINFSPVNVTLGSTPAVVRWTNNDGVIHTVTSGALRTHTFDGIFDSGDLSSGQTFCMNFLVSGTYGYFCRHHSAMIGSITAP